MHKSGTLLLFKLIEYKVETCTIILAFLHKKDTSDPCRNEMLIRFLQRNHPSGHFHLLLPTEGRKGKTHKSSVA